MESYTTTPAKHRANLYEIAQNVLYDRRFHIAVALMLIVNVSMLCLAYIHPAAGESYLYYCQLLSGFMTITFQAVVFFMIAFIGVSLLNIAVTAGIKDGTTAYLSAKVEHRQQSLPIGNTIHLGSDIILVRYPNESEPHFADRLQVARDGIKPGQWIAVLMFRVDTIFAEWAGHNTQKINRQKFDSRPDFNYSGETEQEFANYVNDFTTGFASYSLEQKTATAGSNTMAALQNILKASANVVLFLLLCLPVLAQNTKQVVDKLGTKANDKVPSGTTVRFTFDKGTMQRTATGDKTIAELVTYGRPGSDAIDYGRLNGVDTNGVALLPGKTVIPSDGNFDKPAPLFKTHMESHNEVVPQKSFTESLPDSATVANTLNEAKQQLPVYKQVVYKMFKPVWEFAAWLFFFLCPLFGIALGFCNLVSRSARQNGNLGPAVADQQIRFAAAAWWISICVVGSAYICITASMFFWEWNPYVITALCILGYIPAKWAINRLTPNGEYQETITTTRQSGRIGGGNGQRFLNQ